jgi:hypothetical protein
VTPPARYWPEYAIEAACLGGFMLSAAALRRARATFVSPGEVALPGHGLGFAGGLAVRDPDGHVLQAVEVP